MTEAPTPSKFTKWKRPLIGGLLSAGIAGISLLLWSFNILLFQFVWAFWIPVFPAGIFWVLGNYDNPLIYGVPLILWFLAGAALAYFSKTNKSAISYWICIYTICIFLGLVLYPSQ